MTHEQDETSAHLPGINGTTSSFLDCSCGANAGGLANRSRLPPEPNAHFDTQQYAPHETTNMSCHGPFEHEDSTRHRLSGEWIMQQDEGEESEVEASRSVVQRTFTSNHTQTDADESYREHRPAKRARIHYHEFAAQARLERYHQRRQRFLTFRKRTLQRSIALSARLRRTASWIQDGLVEVSRHNDTTSFARVFSHVQDLVDICYSHWNNELQSLGTLGTSDTAASIQFQHEPFFDQLHAHHQRNLLELVSALRSNPQFLVDRFRNLSRSQVATLTTKPRWEASESFLTSFSQDSGRQTQRRRRLQAYSKELEDYATSFERSNPLSFLLFNIYSHDATPESPESQLRLYTWSTVCADLLECGAESYSSLYWQVLEAFSATHEWPAKTRVELFLMDVLQRGAFLLEDDLSQRGKLGYNPLTTDQAHEFFQSAAKDLYWILIESGTGCYPTGALSLARAILGKLSLDKHQMDFRGHFFSAWYLNHFLRAAIMYPENENMLLKVHISKRAREYILAPLFNRFADKIENPQNHTTPADETIQNIFLALVNMLEGEQATNPYQAKIPARSSQMSGHAGDEKHMLVICASEIIKVLEALSPQAIHSSYEKDPTMRPVMRMIRHAFDTEPPRAHTRFDMLKQALLGLLEPGTSAKDIHPCSEAWAEFRINAEGMIHPLPALKRSDQVDKAWESFPMSIPQQAALRLCTGSVELDELDETSLLTQWSDTSTLTELFREQIDRCQAEAHTLDCIFWKKALLQLHRQYPLSKPDLGNDDTLVLLQPYNHARAYKEMYVQCCSLLEDEIGAYEKTHRYIKKLMTKFAAGLELLRLKLWYASEVINSNAYLDARNIAAALNNMTTQTMRTITNIDTSSRASLRPTSSRSAVSSIFGQRRNDTIELLKAPNEHGGPRKLADSQIEAVKRWLKKNDIDNFCPGEERLHRFCMEIQLVAKRLTGETMVESPDLWSSELFVRERSFYDVQSFGISSAPASTRPASVISDSFSATYPVVRPGMRYADSDTRSTASDERSSIRRGSVHSLFFRSLNPQLLTPELASSIGSYGRASSAATTTSEIFSNPSQSVTSASVYSRTPSILHNSYAHHPSTSLREKRKFREQLQKGLICLLLSDLGCLVWSWGCETDAWVNNVQNNHTVAERLAKRMAAEVLFPGASKPRIGRARRKSMDGVLMTLKSSHMENASGNLTSDANEEGEIGYVTALRDILERISQHVDPVEKLQACHDFSNLATEQFEACRPIAAIEKNVGQLEDVEPTRRKSLDCHQPTDSDQVVDRGSQLSLYDNSKPSDTQINRHIRRQLAALKPRTIFRDLQYIAVFTPKELLEKTPAGDAFVHLGMATLDYKNELCRSMVDIADQIVTADGIKRTITTSAPLPKPEYSLSKAAEYWKIGAVEGHAVAMRELAGLYLMHPEILPVVTSPLVSSGEIFKEERMWQKRLGSNSSRQALCLALHWMQQAAEKGDKIASRRLEERDGSLSTS